MLCSAVPTDEDHFSAEADAAVSEMTRGAVLVAQVQPLSGEALLLVAQLVSSALPCVLHKPQSQSLAPGKCWGWELLSALPGTGRDECSPLFVMQAGGREPGCGYRAQQGLVSSSSGVPWVCTALPVLPGFTPWTCGIWLQLARGSTGLSGDVPETCRQHLLAVQKCSPLLKCFW